MKTFPVVFGHWVMPFSARSPPRSSSLLSTVRSPSTTEAAPRVNRPRFRTSVLPAATWMLRPVSLSFTVTTAPGVSMVTASVVVGTWCVLVVVSSQLAPLFQLPLAPPIQTSASSTTGGEDGAPEPPFPEGGVPPGPLAGPAGGPAGPTTGSATVMVVVTVEVPGGRLVALADTEALSGRPTTNGASDACPGSGAPSVVRREARTAYAPLARPVVSTEPRFRVWESTPGVR